MSQEVKQDNRIEIQKALALSRLALDQCASQYNRYSAEFREFTRARKVLNRLSKTYGQYEIRRED